MKLKGVLAPYFAVAIRFIFLLVIYALLRLGFYGINASLFPHIDAGKLLVMFAGGVRFDIVALLYLNILYIVMLTVPGPFKDNRIYQQVAKWIFVVVNSIGIALNLIDFAYYPFTLKRTTGTVIDQFSNESNLVKLAFDFCLDYWYLIVLLALIVYGLMRSYQYIQLEKITNYNWKSFLIQVPLFLLTAFLFIGGVRGGWAHSTRPITLSNAGDYVETPEEMNIVLNTPFSILKTLKAVSLKPVHYYSDQELEQLYNPIHIPKADQPFTKKNVVVLILESFAKEHFGELNKDIQGGKYKGYTPFLDSLIRHAYTFTDTYANGRKSIDALPSVITGIPSIGEPFVLSIYSGNETTSLAKLLGKKGYETAFFHGAPNGSMGFSAYMKLAGIQHYFGKNEYNNDADFDGIWGIWDEPFLQFVANKINTFHQPFFASFFSLSSHHPFKVPEKYQGKFPKGPLPVQEPIGYTDNALREFFATASKMPWYKNTVFVICADHATVSYLPEYQTAAGGFQIPIIFYAPGDNLVGKADKLVQQIDIMPTILNYLHYDEPYFAFGSDAFKPGKDNFVLNNNAGSYNLYYKDYMMSYDGLKATSFYDLKKDRLMKQDLLKQHPAVLDTMESKMKAFIQQYNNRMIENKLTYKK
ncbi:phosphoglycerol transferase MdoB-like AlkP superfamily enzyme [Sphingobacterium zeae]|uniref:Phosphoglycerol transferase MdoB-like AlkP superfamily enzyme n=2 Tax=Sphingobacterium zeae TaxID=1776859 RepID=A0ABU0U4P8_9SPHI|nr:alkaline phosphatase family protein [Sphingobacterium zeae]MDQ1149188.1 phosphoglycerol transferase MdoB-like AlkP superfamily enzyme [Sphingobacterium zeae]